MMSGSRKGSRGISGQIKDRLIQHALERRARRVGRDREDAPDLDGQAPGLPADARAGLDALCRFDEHPAYRQLRVIHEGATALGIPNPYFKTHDGRAGSTTLIGGRPFLNFSSYNYLGLSGHPQVNAAAKQAIDRYGTSVSASRLVSGERPIHRALEQDLARLYGVDDCVAFVSGHATNVSTIAALCGPGDLVLHDALIHNSVLQGAALSGARRLAFPHNDWRALDARLTETRRDFQRVLIVLEGVYSMDGDLPDLPRFVEVKRRHKALLMVDEAHALGVLGAGGRGIAEHFGLDGQEVDIWMGTLSKALASCGGYIAGEGSLIELVKCTAAGFVYSVGLAPAMAAAALASLGILRSEPQRVAHLRERAQLFLHLARERGVDVGLSQGLAIVPAITGSSIKAGLLAEALFQRGINVQPILYPAVTERAARLRFFLSCEHSKDQVQAAVEALAEALRRL